MNKHYVAAFILAMVCWTGGQAVALDKLDSIQFSLRYEADTLPGEAGWSGSCGSPSSDYVSDGWFHMVSTDGSSYQNASWEVDSNTSYTVEIRYRTPVQGRFCISVDDGVDRVLFHIKPDALEYVRDYRIYSDYLINIAENVSGADYRLRFASWLDDSGDRLIQIWRDGVCLYGPTNDIAPSLGGPDPEDLYVEFLFGDNHGEGCEMAFDYLRMDKTGAYAPDVPDASFYFVSKIKRYMQTTSAAPVSGDYFGTDNFGFFASLQATASNSVVGATCTRPGGAPETMSASDTWWEISGGESANWATLAEMDAAYPSGTYTMTITPATDNGGNPISASLVLAGDTYPPAPDVSNWAELQSASAAEPVVVSWEPWVGGTVADGIHVSVFSQDGGGDRTPVWESPMLESEGYLPGTATQAVIPSGLLEAGSAYYCEISFMGLASPMNTTDYPGVPGMAFYMASTVLPITTATEVPEPNVSFYFVSKIKRYMQTTSAAPVSGDYFGTDNFGFFASLQATASNSVVGTTCTRPGGAPETMSASDTWWETSGGESANWATLGEMDAAYPSGTYTMTITPATDNGGNPISASLVLAGDTYPPAPDVSNWAELQSASAAEPVVVSWEPWVGGTILDVIYVSVFSQDGGGDRTTVWESPMPESEGYLPGTATQAVIPSGLLEAGSAYYCEISFMGLASPVNTTDYPGVPGMAFYMASTVLPITTEIPEPNVSFYFVSKTKRYMQTTSAAPVSGDYFGTDNFGFFASLQATASNSVVGATCTRPGGAPETMSASDTWWETSGGESANWATLAEMDAAYPSGTYTMTITPATDNGGNPISASLVLTGDTYPPAPDVSNWTELQSASAAEPVVVSWEPWVGGTILDVIYVSVFSQDGGGDRTTVWESPMPESSGYLPGTATQAVIPSGLLEAGSAYYCEIIFMGQASPVNTTDYPGVPGMAFYMASTVLPITTATEGTTASGIPFRWLEDYDLPTDGSVDHECMPGSNFTVLEEWLMGTNPHDPEDNLRMTDAPDLATEGVVVRWRSVAIRTYRIERSTNLMASPAFTTLATGLQGIDGVSEYTDSTAVGNGPYFYRVAVE